MSLLGGISKNSEALRYHARTAEIAGQNLAHVNDETYARQRVLAKEGVMYSSHGGLQTSGLENGGLDHARSKLLDNRVIVEVSETASLEARQEILELLQAAMGESLTNSSVNAGLDEDHESILSPGSLSRALNDFFNSFHELSVAPNDATTKQEILNKIETLVNRFNETGNNLDQIESDLTVTLGRSVDQVNSILTKLHEVNKQVRRFELQDNGKAVVYRDRRQALLEELSSFLNFSIEEDIDPATGIGSGLINLFVDAKDGRKINLLDPTGPKSLTNNWGQNIQLGESIVARDLAFQGETDPQIISNLGAAEKAKMNPGGRDAVVRAKVDAGGKLAEIEVIDGGTLYDDSDAPILLSFLPPKPLLDGDEDAAALPDQANEALDANPAGQPVDFGNEIAAVTGGAIQLGDLSNVTIENSARKKGDVFYFAKEDDSLGLWQALEDTIAGVNPNDSDQFMEITDWPNGKVNETKRKFSDLESFSKGDQIYYEGKYYQALHDVSPLAKDVAKQTTSKEYGVDETFTLDGLGYKVLTALPSGVDFSDLDATLAVGQTVKLTNSAGFSGEVEVVEPDGNTPVLSATSSTSRVLSAKDVFEYEGNFYQALSDLPVGMDLSALFSDDPDFVLPAKGETVSLQSVMGNSSGSVLALGASLPQEDQDKDYPLFFDEPLNRGEVAKFRDSYYMYVGDDIVLDALQHNDILQTPVGSSDFIKINAKIDSSVKELDREAETLSLKVGETYYHNETHFIVKDVPYNQDEDTYELTFSTPEEISSFDPFDAQWSDYILEFSPETVDGDPTKIIKKDAPVGHNIENGPWVELNLGIAEAIVQGGEIKDFKIINEGNGLPPESAVFLDGLGEGVATELDLKSGSIEGYQDAQLNAVDKYRQSLNSLVSDFVKQVNEIYNPTDEPGGYLFGFDAFLSRPIRGANTFLEETYGLPGKEGNGELTIFDEEVDMTLPYAENETFRIVSSGNILPGELAAGWDAINDGDAYFRDEANPDVILDQDEGFAVATDFYAAARRMQHVTIDYDASYPGEDKILNTGEKGNDDGRHLLRGYESIPIKINPGSELYVLGDNFSFDAVVANEWNLASALKIDDNLTIDNIKSSENLPDGSNDIALNIAKFSDGSFTEKISVMNADLGNEMGDLSDNLEHQKSLENLLLDQRRAVSSVSIDEEVADLMQFQRSFQASSRVLNTLDKMLELVVMGLVK